MDLHAPLRAPLHAPTCICWRTPPYTPYMRVGHVGCLGCSGAVLQKGTRPSLPPAGIAYRRDFSSAAILARHVSLNRWLAPYATRKYNSLRLILPVWCDLG
jgi:hypothetical protein